MTYADLAPGQYHLDLNAPQIVDRAGNALGNAPIVTNFTVTGIDPLAAQVQDVLAHNPGVHYNFATGKFYAFVATTNTWAGALADAPTHLLAGVTGQLATIYSSTENIFVSGPVANSPKFWLGAANPTISGDWRWYAGTSPSEQFWTGGRGGSGVGGLYNGWVTAGPFVFTSGLSGAVGQSNTVWFADNGTALYGYAIEWLGADVLGELAPRLIDKSISEGMIVGTSSQTFTFEFSKALDPNTVTASAFRLIGPDGTAVAPAAIALQQNGRLVQVTYSGLGAGSDRFEIDTSRIRDVAGHVMGSSVLTTHFTVQNFSNQWVNSSTGTWNTAANWSAGSVPTAQSNVFIALPASSSLTIDTIVNVAQLVETGMAKCGSSPCFRLPVKPASAEHC